MIAAGVRAVRELAALTRELPNLRVVAISGALGTLGAGLINPVLPVYLESRGLNLERIGILFTVAALIPILLQPIVGALSDRFSRKAFVVALSLGTSLLIPLFGVLSAPWMLAVALAGKLMLAESTTPVYAAMVSDFAPAKSRATVFALLDSITTLTLVAALVASAGVVEGIGLSRVFFVAGALFIGSSLTLIAVKETASGPRPTTTGMKAALSGITAPFRYAIGNRSLAGLFGFQFCFSFGLDLFPVYLPLYAVKLGASQALVGPLIASSWLVYALVQPAGGRFSDRRSRRKDVILLGLAGMGICALVLGLAGWAPGRLALILAAGAWMLMAIPDGLFRPSVSALCVELAPEGERGTLMGSLGAVSALAGVVSPLAYGALAQRLGLGAAFVLAGVAFLGAMVSILRITEPASLPSPVVAPAVAVVPEP